MRRTQVVLAFFLAGLLCGCQQQPPQSVFDSWQPPQTSTTVSKPERLALSPGSFGVEYKKSVVPAPPKTQVKDQSEVGYIRVVIADQRLYAYVRPGEETPLKTFECSTAASGLAMPLEYNGNITHNHTGGFIIDSKDINHNAGKMPFSLHYWSGHYIHATEPRFEKLLGTPASQGCVRLRLADAKWLFDHTPEGCQLIIE